MLEPQVKISVVANTWVKQMHFLKAGYVALPHKHTFDHQTLLGKGRVKVSVNGKDTEFTAPTIIFIRAGYEHTITALEDDTVCYCIHAIRDGERVEDIVDPNDIPEGGKQVTALALGPSKKIVVKPTPMQYLE